MNEEDLPGRPEGVQDPAGSSRSDVELIGLLVARARAEGLQLTGEGGLLQHLTKRVLEAALDGEMTDHLGYEYAASGRGSGNSRNGTRTEGADRYRPCRDRGAAGCGEHV